MKNFLTLVSILSLALFASCGGGATDGEDSNATDANTTDTASPASE
ncbi:MAG: hypothetical protein HOH60_07025 [Opitutae bacterium]|jgi:hypothetical protein|nr:hypothetical protein [Opitutae bacterium]MBT5916091.1 hypothetical protein [Opitutae bacterium]MBT7405811.1 hypothetical protein [Opitutae bacterium]